MLINTSRSTLLSFFIIYTLASTAAPTIGLRKPCPAQLRPTDPCAPCSLKQWTQKINTLKERPVQFSSLPKKKHYQQNILSLKEFLSTLRQCSKVIADTLQTDEKWLNKKSLVTLAPEIFNLDRPFTRPIDEAKNFTFKPYAQRLFVKPGTIFVLFGDLHGSIHSFLRDLTALQNMGYLDDDFKIKKNNLTMVFLGDYIDRGIYGVEVTYTIARLKIANPSQVVLVRGNHEDYLLAPDFKKRHTKEEEKDNAPSFIDELYAKFDLHEKDEVTIFRLYELLPLVLYLGCGTNGHKDFMMCCHGGLELGYNPYNLLHAQDTVTFEYIDKLWRKRNFTKKLPKDLQNMIKHNFDLPILCAELQDFVPPAPFFQITPERKTYIGFLWNDFYVDPTKQVGARGKRCTGWVYGKELAKELLSWGSSSKVTLQGIFRAHQHNNETGGPMLNLLCCNKGIVSFWEHEHLYTLLSAPDSKLEETGQACFTYDSFVVLTTASKFKNWRFKHYHRDLGLNLDPQHSEFRVSHHDMYGKKDTKHHEKIAERTKEVTADTKIKNNDSRERRCPCPA